MPLFSFDAMSVPLWLLATCFTAGLLHANPTTPGKPLLDDGLSSLRVFGAEGINGLSEVVPVDGQRFGKALRIDTFKRTNVSSDQGLEARLTDPIRKGDVLWISFWARSLESRRETGESSVDLRVDQLKNGEYVWPPHLERGISFGREWTETSIPFAVTQDIEPKDIRLILNFDTYAQRFELGPVTFLNYGQSVAVENLPRTVVHYPGGEPDAPWRQAALDRIEKIRKGDLVLRVVDATGQPVPDAAVQVRMKRNAFNWGTEIQSRRILDDHADARKYREVLAKHFNQVVYGNEMKWGRWANVPDAEKGVRMKRANAWLRERGLGIRGHVMVWPSWQHMPRFMRENQEKPEFLRTAVLDHISEQTRIMQGEFGEWDVINEPYAHNDLMRILGRDVMTTWFQAARTGAPDAKLFINDYTMFHGEGSDSPSEKFYDNVKFLLDRGAPVDAVGEQAHIGSTPPGIPKVLERLDRFSKLGLPIQISEFDINSNDEDFKARYTRDFMIAIYSHPATTGFVQWGFWEPDHWFPTAAMWRKDWSMRPNGEAYAELVTRKWWTDADGRTDAKGETTVRGFYGEFEVTVAHGSGSQTSRISHAAGSPVQVITLR